MEIINEGMSLFCIAPETCRVSSTYSRSVPGELLQGPAAAVEPVLDPGSWTGSPSCLTRSVVKLGLSIVENQSLPFGI